MNQKALRVLLLALLPVAILAILLPLVITETIDQYNTRLLTLAGINIIVALSLNLISGFTGQLALGQASFLSIGAFTTVILTMNFHWPLLPAILVAGLAAALVAAVIGFPALRLRGDYLAIVTLAFGEIIMAVLNNIPEISGGPTGINGIPGYINEPVNREILGLFFGPDLPRWNHVLGFVWVFIFVVFVVVVVNNLIKSTYGRTFIAIRDDEVAAGAMGVNVYTTKVLAFMISAFLAGIAGGLYAPFQRYINANDFGFLKSIEYVIILVLGGMGSITGTVIAGLALTFLQEWLRGFQEWLKSLASFLKDLPDFRLVIYSGILILVMLFRPQGLMGTREFRISLLDNLFKSPKNKNPDQEKKE